MHLHAQIWSMNGWLKGNIVKAMETRAKRCVEGWDSKQKETQSNGVEIGYNDWYLHYLLDNDEKKLSGDASVVLLNNPPDDTEPYYPTEEEQDRVKAKANAKDQLMHSWLELWNEYGEDHKVKEDMNIWNIPGCSLLCVGTFCSDIWFKLKLKPTCKNVRDQRDFVKRLHSYIKGYCLDEDLLGPKDLEIAQNFISDAKEYHAKMDNG